MIENKESKKDWLSYMWLNIHDACAYSGLGKSTIYRNIDRGLLKVSKVTGKLLFKKSWIDEWLEAK